MNNYVFIDLRARPELEKAAAAWFHEKWGVPEEAYLECMDAYLAGETPLGWFLCLEEGPALGGQGSGRPTDGAESALGGQGSGRPTDGAESALGGQGSGRPTDGARIVAGLGVIENDFHDRKDLTPNVCAVYTEEAHRGRGIAGRLLNLAVEDLRAKGISPAYLVTDHTGFYERYGWEFLCMVQGDGEPEPTRMYVHK